MAGWWEDYKKRKGLSSGDSGSQSGKTYSERMTTDEHRQAAKSSTWWEDYKKKNDLERKAASDRQRAVQTASRLKYRSERNQRFASANRQLDENRSRDAAEDEIRELFRNPFSSDAEWQAGVLQRNAERYKRDLPLYQQAMQNSSTWGEYFSAHRQAGESQSAVKHQFERYQQATQKAEQERNESNLVNRPAQWQAENLTPQEIEQRLAYYRSEAATPTVTDRDREEHSYLYPEAALQKAPHGARFDERLLEGAGQDAIDALYRPILTEQEKAAVEEADRQIIEEKASRNYEQVQRLLAAQAGQTEAASRARGNELIGEIAQGGEAAEKAKTGKAMFEQQQKKIDEESPTIIYGARGNYSSAMAERTKRGYILGSDWDNVPEDRKQAVYALYTESPEKAIELAKYYIADAQQEEDEERQAWYAQSGWTAALGLASSAAAHLGAAVDPFGPVGQELTRYGDNALAGGSQWADAATGYQKIPELVPIVGGKGAGDFYQTVGSVVQSAAVAAPAILAGRYDQAAAEVLSKLGLALMGSSAAASDYRESVAAGMDEDRAKLHALAAGVEEALFEEVSLDKLIKMDTSGGLKAALKNWLVQSGIEGSEELATSIANRITDEMISGAGQSKVERRASELIANGMNSTEAHTQAESEWMTDTLYEGFSGFLSGGMMTGGDYALQGAANLTERAVNAAETRKAQRQAGAAVSRSEGSVEAIQAYAKDKGIEIKTVETAEQNAEENAEQGSQEAKQNSYSARDYRSISDTNSKVVQSIRNEVRGKTVQEQQAVRDSLVEKYGEGIAPVVNQAISVETAARVRQEYGNVDSIQAARNRAVSEIKDESLRRAVSDGYDSAAYSLAASQGGDGGMNAMSRYIQQRNNTGTGEMSMNATVAAQDGSTKTVAITGMSEDGKRVSLADGSEVAVKDLQADADTTSAIQQLADLDLGADATKVLQAYQQSGVAGTEGYRWLMDYATAYNQGRTRQISLEQAAQRSSLDERTVMDAYTLGQQAANRETQAGLEKLKNLPKRKGASGRTANIDTTEIKGKTMSKSELEQFALANQYAQALGVDMKWFSSKEKDGKFVGKNGAYENGKIYMDIHAGRNFAADLTSGILATMGHELTHFQQQFAPEEYQAIKEFLFEQIVKSSPNGEAILERLIWEKQKRSGNTLSRKAAEDEVVADACQKMLRDSKAVHDFASQQPEAANGVIRWLDKWFKKVRSIFGRGGNYSEEAQIMDSLEQDVKAAFGELWDKALKQAVQVHDEVGNIEKAAEESNVQNSDRDTEYLELAKDPEKNAAKLQEMVDEANEDIRFSERPNTDSAGRELSEGQQEYFKDSKVRDGEGHLIPVYHGTKADFHVFDFTQGGVNGTQEGFGIYLTNDKRVSDSYGDRVIEGYANIKRPATSWQKTIKRGELVKLIKTTCMQEAQRMVNDGEYDSVQEALFDTWISNYVLTYESASMEPNYRKAADVILQANSNDMDIIQEVIIGQGIRSYPAAMEFYHNALIPATGIDGFWTKWKSRGQGVDADVILAFDSNQVKNVDNLNPTDNPDIRYSERDYSTPSDEELLMNARVEDADNADQGRLLKDYQALGKRIATLEKQLADARRQTQLTNRALNTRGIGNVVKTVMKDYDITDARHNGTAKNATLALTDGYQKALDLLDKGASPADVNDAVYNGAVKAAEIILDQGTYSQNLGGKLQVYSASRYLGDNSQELIDSFVSEAYADFVSNRYREARPETAADRLVARTKKEAQERVDKYKGRSDALAEANRRLEEKATQAETEAKEARKAAGELFLEIKDLRQELMDNKTMSEQERKAASKKLKSLNKSLEAKREEAASWQKRAKRNASLLKSALESKSRDISALNNRLSKEQAAALEKQKSLEAKREEAASWQKRAKRNASLLKSALESKNRDISALNNRLSKEQAAALEKQKSLEAKLEKQIQKYRDILAGKANSPELNKLLKAEREKAEAQVKKQKKAQFARYKDRKNRTAIRNRIKNLHAEMSRDLLRPREGHFVPEKLIRPVVDLLDLVNTETNRAKSESAQARIAAINAAYDAIKKDERYSQFYDETVKDMLVVLSGTMAGRSIYDLTTAELEDVYTVMKAMRTTIRNAIKADLIEKGKEIWEIGNEMRQELRAGRGAHALQLLEKYHMTMLSAKRAFNRFGGYQQSSAWNKVYRMLDDAQLKMLTLEMQGTRIFDRVLEGKENLEKAEKLTSYREDDLVDVGLKDETGKAVPIPRGMMLSLYMHLQNEENMRHLMYGGITLPDFKHYYKGRSEAWGQGTVSIPALGAMVAPLDELFSKGELSDAEYEEAYKEHKAEIDEIFDSIRKAIEEQLTDYDLQWIAASREFFDGFSRRELNRVTNEMYGFSKARVNNYFPIVTDSDFLKSEFESISKNISLENAGFMKERVRASNPIYLEDITKAVNRQISNVSRYAGLTQALKTFGNVYNVQDRGFTDSVKKAMAKTYGKNGQQYVENLITDMVGGRNTPGTIFDRVKGNYAQAVLAANLSVTIKQAASFPTAAATVGWGPLMKAMARGGKSNLPISRADSNLISIYSPLLWYRSKGAIDVEIGDIANGRDWTQKAKWLMGWIEKTDRATVGRLWYAAEYYVKDNYNLEKGTEEQIKNGESPFYRKVAEVFADIVEDTQPNYTILQRPDILRNPNKLVRAMVMFSTQRFQNGNILIDAIGEYRAMVRADKQNGTSQTKTARKAARQKLTRAISSQTVSAMVLSAMTLLAGAVMHRMNPWRDDDDELTFESIAEEYLNGFLSSLTGSFLAGSEVYEGLQAMLTGSKYYGNDVGGISTINELATSVIQFEQQAVKLIGDEDSTAKDWQNLAEKQLWKVGEYLSQMTGIPTANIKKIIEGGRNHIADIMNEEFFSFEAGVDRSTAVNARRYMKAIQAGDTEKAEAVMKEMRKNFKEEKPGLSEKAITRKVRNALASYIKEQYTSKQISEEDAISYLVDYVGKKENDAFWQIREWEAKKAHKGEAEYTFSPYEHLRELIDNGKDLTGEIAYLQEHGKTASAINSDIKKYIRQQFDGGELNEQEAMKMLQKYHKVKDDRTGKYRNDTEDEAWFILDEWKAGIESEDDEEFSYEKYRKLYSAMDNDDDASAAWEEMSEHGVSDDTLKKAVSAHLQKQFQAGEISEDVAIDRLQSYRGMDEDKAYWQVDKWKSSDAAYKAGEDFNESNYRDLYAAIDGNKDPAAAMKELTSHGYKESDVYTQAKKYLSEKLEKGEITEQAFKNKLSRYCKIVKADEVDDAVQSVKNSVRYKKLMESKPNLDATESQVNAWYDGTANTRNNGHESAKTAGMSIENYIKAKTILADVKDANGNRTGEDEYIVALTKITWLTPRQKDALYYERYKGTTKYSHKTW